MQEKCAHCGAEWALHRYPDNACPVNGMEAPSGKVQKWADTFYSVLDPHDPELAALRKENARLKNDQLS